MYKSIRTRHDPCRTRPELHELLVYVFRSSSKNQKMYNVKLDSHEAQPVSYEIGITWITFIMHNESSHESQYVSREKLLSLTSVRFRAS